jgi:hypothetical protein
VPDEPPLDAPASASPAPPSLPSAAADPPVAATLPPVAVPPSSVGAMPLPANPATPSTLPASESTVVLAPVPSPWPVAPPPLMPAVTPAAPAAVPALPVVSRASRAELPQAMSAAADAATENPSPAFLMVTLTRVPMQRILGEYPELVATVNGASRGKWGACLDDGLEVRLARSARAW